MLQCCPFPDAHLPDVHFSHTDSFLAKTEEEERCHLLKFGPHKRDMMPLHVGRPAGDVCEENKDHRRERAAAKQQDK